MLGFNVKARQMKQRHELLVSRHALKMGEGELDGIMEAISIEASQKDYIPAMYAEVGTSVAKTDAKQGMDLQALMDLGDAEAEQLAQDVARAVAAARPPASLPQPQPEQAPLALPPPPQANPADMAVRFLRAELDEAKHALDEASRRELEASRARQRLLDQNDLLLAMLGKPNSGRPDAAAGTSPRTPPAPPDNRARSRARRRVRRAPAQSRRRKLSVPSYRSSCAPKSQVQNPKPKTLAENTDRCCQLR